MNRSQAKNKTKFEILKKKFFFKFWKLYQKKLKMFPKNQIFAKNGLNSTKRMEKSFGPILIL